MHVGTQRLIGTFDRRQRETDAPGAEHDRGHDQMQPVEAAGSQEPRNGVRAAFDEDTAQAALGRAARIADGAIWPPDFGNSTISMP